MQDIKKKVGEINYSIQKLTVRQSIPFLLKLGKLMAPGLKAAIDADVDLQNWKNEDIIQVASGILESADPNKTSAFMIETIQSMVVQPVGIGKGGTDEKFDEYYADKEAELMEAFYACVDAQTGGVVAWVKKKFMGSEPDTNASSPPASQKPEETEEKD